MSVQASLTYLCSFNVCTCGACLRLFCYEEQKVYVIAVVAIVSFLAGTRNLMLGVHFVIASFSVCFETRSLVLARDDGAVGAGGFLWVFTVFVLRQKNIRTKVLH